MTRHLKALFLLVLCGEAQSLVLQQRVPHRQKAVSTSQKAMLADYTGAAASLFNNMRTPASIIAGAMLPIGFLSPLKLDPDEDDGRFVIFLRRIYPLISVLSLCSQLLSVMWATVAVNQLTETTIEATSSVWHLIQRDFYLPWVATNAHFVIGMMGFMWVISTRAYFLADKGPAGLSAAGMACSSLLLMISIVNNGVAAGGGKNMRFGSSVVSLLRAYAVRMINRASSAACFNPVERSAAALFVFSLGNGIRIALCDVKQKPPPNAGPVQSVPAEE